MIPEKTDVFGISGRIKNMLASKDLSLGPAGSILVNSYSLVLKDLHEFAETLPEPYAEQLASLLIEKEGLPLYVIVLSTPKPDPDDADEYESC